ncbi:MAG: nickel pincer cofactor biosynthesis protein LarC [Syntrophomonadaceae bacterium]|jgi:uncharacterized protein (TIGR00299 family) protein|nr:nickel pincer cofactor biosynthesis protein LarC [Syntrophomonadaceae bacterium]
MKLAYLDCFSGISGDMLLGALIDIGADAHSIEAGINSLPIEPLTLAVKKQQVMGISCTDVQVVCPTSTYFRNLTTITELLTASDLPEKIQNRARTAFRLLARAEARVHGVPIEQVHFHELGALDTIADVVGCLLGFDELGVDNVVASPLPWNRGCLEMAHGVYPLPAPASVELMLGIPCYGVDTDIELVTPTGAVLLRVLTEEFGPLPSMIPHRVGYGAGKSKRADTPNVLRLLIGEDANPTNVVSIEKVGVIETQVDDMPAEHFSWLAEQFIASPALDYYFTPVQMKKERPGTLITVLASPSDIPQLVDLLLAHTSTLGVRHWLAERRVLPRESVEIDTHWGKAKVKIARLHGLPPRIAPEYEDCRRIAITHDLPVDAVYREILHQAMSLLSS